MNPNISKGGQLYHVALFRYEKMRVILSKLVAWKEIFRSTNEFPFYMGHGVDAHWIALLIIKRSRSYDIVSFQQRLDDFEGLTEGHWWPVNHLHQIVKINNCKIGKPTQGERFCLFF